MDDVPLLLVLLILSGFFSGAEIALFSLSPARIKALKNKAKDKKAAERIARLELLKNNPNQLLVTILIGNNVVNIGASALATVMALRIGSELGFGENENVVLAAVTGAMTFLILLFGEITPKSLAHRHALRFSLFAVPILNVLQITLYPIVWPLSKLVRKFSGDEEMLLSLSEEELKAAIELSEKEGKIEYEEKELVEKVLEFDELAVEYVMTPRSKIFALPDATPLRDAVKQINDQHFSRIPIYHDDLDHIVGVLTVQNLLGEILKKDFSKKKVANASLLSPFKIPPTMRLSTLLREFKAQKLHMAFVHDEHGGLVGLITMEDILEEIVGEIQDEQDELRPYLIRREGKNKILCDSNVELEHLEEFMQEKMPELMPEKFPWELEDENKTISYFFLEKREHFPEVGDTLEVGGHEGRIKFTIRKIDGEKIQEVEVEIG